VREREVASNAEVAFLEGRRTPPWPNPVTDIKNHARERKVSGILFPLLIKLSDLGNYRYNSSSQVCLLAVFSPYAAAILCNFPLQNEGHLTCTLRGGYIGAGLVPEEESAVVRTGVDVARWIRARAVTTVIRKGHGSAKGAGYRGCFLAEHGVQQRIPRNIRAERRQRVSTVTVSCKRKLIDINSHVR